MLTYERRYLDDREIHRRWIDPRMYTVRVPQIRAYLLSKGWQEVSPDRPHVLAFREPTVPEDGPLYQWIPDSESWRDYPARIYEFLAAVAEIEDRYAGDVLTDILRQPAEAPAANGPAAQTKAETAPK